MAVNRSVRAERKTAETGISISLDPDLYEPISIDTGIGFFDHMLHAMAFHGGFSLDLRARGDLNVDFHHTVEDTGITLGEAFRSVIDTHGPVERFGHAVVPMDEALSEVTIDACGRPSAVFTAAFPQSRAGDFDMALLRDFFHAFANSSKSAVHAACAYGENSHHMAEALFKAFGMALRQAYRKAEKIRSTKGKA